MNTSEGAIRFKEKAKELLALAEQKESDVWNEIDIEDIQNLFECLLKIYGHRVRNLDPDLLKEGHGIKPLPEKSTLTHTDAVIFIDHLLELKDIELFEVQMWRSIG